MKRRPTVLDAPSNLGLKPPRRGVEPGVRGLADALRRQDLVRQLNAMDGGRIVPPAYSPRIDRGTGIRNAPALAAYSDALARGVAAVLDQGAFPLVLGGDCSIQLGTALALRRRGRYGLLFLDGHLDLLNAETSESKAAAGMDLGLVTGRGPDLLANLGGLRPLMQDRDIVLLGYRDEVGSYGPIVDEVRDRFGWFPLDQLRLKGAHAVADAALVRLQRLGLDGVWIHFDVDVLDDELMPAVDSRMPGGMTWDELITVLRIFLDSGITAGLQVTIFDPSLDPDGRYARALTACLATVFRDGIPPAASR